MLVYIGYNLLINALGLGRKPVDRADLVAQQEGDDPQGADNPIKPGKPDDKENSDKPNQQDPNPKDLNPKDPDGKDPQPENAPDVAIKALPEDNSADFVTLGSLDSKNSGYRFLVTLSSKGAGVHRIELNDRLYRSLDKRESDQGRSLDKRIGYLGNLEVIKAPKTAGFIVRVVGPGTPAAEAGLLVGDVIIELGETLFNNKDHKDVSSFNKVLKASVPGEKLLITILRPILGDAKTIKKALSADLVPKPLQLIRPELAGVSPDSLLLTLNQVDDDSLFKFVNSRVEDENPGGVLSETESEWERRVKLAYMELKGVSLRTKKWTLPPERQSPTKVVFVTRCLEYQLELEKIYELKPCKDKESKTIGYDFDFEFVIKNLAAEKKTVAYRLDGFNSITDEAKWYAQKGEGGLRDIVVGLTENIESNDNYLVNSSYVIGSLISQKDEKPTIWGGDTTISYLGLDANFFSTILIPQKKNRADVWFSESSPYVVGRIDEANKKFTNVSFYMNGKLTTLAGIGEGKDSQISRRFTIFAGPRKPEELAHYPTSRISQVIDLGMFSYISNIMLKVLHFFHGFVGNYGLAIVMLTITVRLCLFPLSLKQTKNAIKMKIMQPELQVIKDKYKTDHRKLMEEQSKLYKKHGVSMVQGCLMPLLQLPIFIGLYRGLQSDIHLRAAPMISETFSWCSNLGAPDMLFRWDGFMPRFIVEGAGYFPAFGPYFNLLPILTVVLFRLQQKIMMPPATDEMGEMQQKVMKWMMVFMAVMFYKVASGLCIYFIVSAIWSMSEKQLLPKPKDVPVTETPATAVPTADEELRTKRIASSSKAKKKKKKKAN